MRWFSRDPDRWRRAFALLPITVLRDTIWLQWYWSRPGGDCTEVCFDKERPK